MEDQRDGACRRSFVSAPISGAQTIGNGNRTSGNRSAGSNVDVLRSQASPCGPLKPPQTSESALFPENSSRSSQHREANSANPTAVMTENTNICMDRHVCSHQEVSVGPACSHLYAGAKRTRSTAFSGHVASMQTHIPSVHSLQRQISLPPGLVEATYGDVLVNSAGFQPNNLTSLLLADEQTNKVLGQCQGALGQLLGVVDGFDSQASVPTMPSAPASVSSVLSGLSTGSSDQLSALLSATSPAVLEQLLAAALAGCVGTPLPDQVLASQAAASICSPESVDGASKRSKSYDLSLRELQRTKAETSRRGQCNWVDEEGCQCTNVNVAAGGQKHNCSESVNVGGGGSGSTSGSAGDASLAAPASNLAAGGGSVLKIEAVCDDPRDDDGPGSSKAGIFIRTKVAEAGANDNGDAVKGSDQAGPSGMGCKAGPSVTTTYPFTGRDSGSWAAGEALAGMVIDPSCDSATRSAARLAPAAPPDASAVQPFEPVSAQVGSALPPDLAARLKKRIRIIQPISQAWVEETLQCTSGATGQLTCSSKVEVHTATAFLGPANTKPLAQSKPALSCPLPSTFTVMAPSDVAHTIGLRNSVKAATTAAAPTTMLQPSSGVATAAPQQGPDLRVIEGGRVSQSSGPSAVTASAQPGSLQKPCARGMPARNKKAPPVAATPQPPLQMPAGLSTANHPSLPAAPVYAADPLPPVADIVSPFTISSAGVLLLPRTISGPTESSAAVLLPQGYDSNTTMVSATPTAATSPLSPGLRRDGSSDATAGDPGPPANAAAAFVHGGAGMSVQPAGRCAPGLDAATAPPAAVTSPPGPVPAALPLAANVGASQNQFGVLHGPQNKHGAVSARPPLHVPPLLLPPSASAGAASGSCLGKVQGELTLLYQWYVANKTVYLDQAQRHLQRVEMLVAAAHEEETGGGGGGAGGSADATVATSVKTESAEAMRAFETALKIMNVCGRVEQQWLSASAAPMLLVEGQGSGQDPVGAAGAGLLESFSMPPTGWVHGASAALAVAAALVGSVALGQDATLRSTPEAVHEGLAGQPVSADPLSGKVARWPVKPTRRFGLGQVAAGAGADAVRSRPSAGLLPPLAAVSRLPTAAAVAAGDASGPPLAAPSMVPPPLQPEPLGAAATTPLLPPIVPRSQATAA